MQGTSGRSDSVLCFALNPPASPERLAMAGVVTQQMEASGSHSG
jgi:hypothetical protein